PGGVVHLGDLDSSGWGQGISRQAQLTHLHGPPITADIEDLRCLPLGEHHLGADTVAEVGTPVAISAHTPVTALADNTPPTILQHDTPGTWIPVLYFLDGSGEGRGHVLGGEGTDRTVGLSPAEGGEADLRLRGEV